MLLLSVDTSGKQGSIALAIAGATDGDDFEVIEIAPLVGGTFSAQLIPQIVELLSRNGFTKSDIGALAAASGPGSFTGLRIGVATARALARAGAMSTWGSTTSQPFLAKSRESTF